MKVGCDVCRSEEASLLCCADEAALCRICDAKIHAANKLASKHRRLPLFNPSSYPVCDICQEKRAYFFCLEDRALLCRQCDYSVHSANALVAAHQRYLVTGVRVGLEPANDLPISTIPTTNDDHRQSQSRKSSAPKKGNPNPNPDDSLSGWRMDDLFNLPEFDSTAFYDMGSSKVSSQDLPFQADDSSIGEEYATGTGSTNCMEDDDCANKCLALVPEMPSPPTLSGLYWPQKPSYRHIKNNLLSDTVFSDYSCAPLVPEIERHSSPPDSPPSKRLRVSM